MGSLKLVPAISLAVTIVIAVATAYGRRGRRALEVRVWRGRKIRNPTSRLIEFATTAGIPLERVKLHRIRIDLSSKTFVPKSDLRTPLQFVMGGLVHAEIVRSTIPDLQAPTVLFRWPQSRDSFALKLPDLNTGDWFELAVWSSGDYPTVSGRMLGQTRRVRVRKVKLAAQLWGLFQTGVGVSVILPGLILALRYPQPMVIPGGNIGDVLYYAEATAVVILYFSLFFFFRFIRFGAQPESFRPVLSLARQSLLFPPPDGAESRAPR